VRGAAAETRSAARRRHAEEWVHDETCRTGRVSYHSAMTIYGPTMEALRIPAACWIRQRTVCSTTELSMYRCCRMYQAHASLLDVSP
jgi:hypothetical protein